MSYVQCSHLLSLIKGRRSTRNFTGEAIEDEILVRLCDAGRWGPSPCNVQSLRFVVGRTAEFLDRLKEVAYGCPTTARAAIVICSESTSRSSLDRLRCMELVAEEAAMACQNMLLLAAAIDIGSCPVAGFARERLSEALQLPETLAPLLVVALGKTCDTPPAPPRRALEQIVEWESCEALSHAACRRRSQQDGRRGRQGLRP